VRVKWNFECGYVTRIPDFEVEIPDEDIEGMSEKEKQKYIDDWIKEEFQNRISYYWEIEKE